MNRSSSKTYDKEKEATHKKTKKKKKKKRVEIESHVKWEGARISYITMERNT